MTKRTALASLLALALAAGAAQAQDLGPRLAGGGDAGIIGGGDNTRIAYGPGVATEAATGLVARLENVNGDQRVVYGPAAAPSGTMLAGRIAQPRG